MFGIRCQIGTSLDARREQKKLFGKSSRKSKRYLWKRENTKNDGTAKVYFIQHLEITVINNIQKKGCQYGNIAVISIVCIFLGRIFIPIFRLIFYPKIRHSWKIRKFLILFECWYRIWSYSKTVSSKAILEIARHHYVMVVFFAGTKAQRNR